MFKSLSVVVLIGGFFLVQEVQSASIVSSSSAKPSAGKSLQDLNKPYQNQLQDLLQQASQHLVTQSVQPGNNLQIQKTPTTLSSSAKDDLVTSIKKLKEQSELYQMINDMLKAESQVQKMPYTIDQDEYEDDHESEGHHDDHENHQEEQRNTHIKHNTNSNHNVNSQQQYQYQQTKPKSHSSH